MQNVETWLQITTFLTYASIDIFFSHAVQSNISFLIRIYLLEVTSLPMCTLRIQARTALLRYSLGQGAQG